MATVFTAVGAAVAKGAAAAKGLFAGASAAGAAGAGTGVLGISQALSAGSALAAIGQGVAASARARTQAEFAKAQAAQEKAQGASEARDFAREYRELISEQRVVQLANGLDIGVGTPVNIAESTKRQAERNLSMTRENARNRSAIARLRGRGLMAEGRASLIGGLGRAGQIGARAFYETSVPQ